MSAVRHGAGMPLPAGDGWAILAQPPGRRDLGREEYWEQSLERSLRRRNARRRPRLIAAGTAPVSIALAALAVGGGGTGAAFAAQGGTAATAASLDLDQGATGAAVTALQRALGITADGIFGPQTLSAVKAYQRAHGLPATGHVGPLTTAALGLSASAATPRSAPATSSIAAAAVALSGDQARAMQRALGVTADGVVGPLTRAALRSFEAAHGLPADGRPDADSLRALGVNMTASATPGAGASAGAGTAIPVADTTAAPSSGVQAAVAAAMTKIGSPYAYGATGPSSFDCSGLVTWAMRQAGISVPRTSFSQYGMGSAVGKSAIQAGDLVFFDTAGAGASDVGLATSPTTAVSATTHGVMTHPILTGYWGSHLVGARRIA